MTLHAVPALHLTLLVPEADQGEQRFSPAVSLKQTVFGDEDFLSPFFSEQPAAPGPDSLSLPESLRNINPWPWEVRRGSQRSTRRP